MRYVFGNVLYACLRCLQEPVITFPDNDVNVDENYGELEEHGAQNLPSPASYEDAYNNVDEEEIDEEEPLPPPRRRQNKGKGRVSMSHSLWYSGTNISFF